MNQNEAEATQYGLEAMTDGRHTEEKPKWQ